MRLSSGLATFLAILATFVTKVEAARSAGQDSAVPAYPAASGKHPEPQPFSGSSGLSPKTKSAASSIPSLIRLTSGSTQLPVLQLQGLGIPQPLRPTGTHLGNTQPTANCSQSSCLPPSLTVPSAIKPPVVPPSPGQAEPTLSATPPTEQPSTPSGQKAEPEPLVLVSEVVVTGTEGALQDEVYRAIRTQPGRTTTRTQLQEDINAVFATGFFANVKATPEDTPLGVRVTFEVQANPVLQSVKLQGNQVISAQEVDRIFAPQYGKILNLRQLQTGIKDLTKWYQDNGYVLAQVFDVPRVGSDGIVTLDVAEGVVEDLQVQFLNKKGQSQDDKGKPIRGRTRDFIILREFELKRGNIFNRNTAEKGLKRAFGLGIFEDLKLALVPGQDPRKVVVQVNVVEKNTGLGGVGFGTSSTIGLFGFFNYNQDNLNGRAQKLTLEASSGTSGVQIQASIKSSGSVEIDRQDRLSNLGVKALSDLNSENGDSQAIEKLLTVLKIAKRDNRKAEYALTLNNLGKIYNKIESYPKAINAYQEAQKLFHELSSPGLELLMFIQLATLHKKNGQPDQALPNYYQALNTINTIDKLQDKRKLDLVVGKTVSTVLSKEWQIDDEHEIDASFDFILSMLKTSILLDIGATYTALGNHQQALYIVNSPELANSSQVLPEKIKNSLNSLVLKSTDLNLDITDLKSSLNITDATTEQELNSLLLESSEFIKSEILSFTTRSNDLFKLLALKFIYADLNEQNLELLYQKEYQQKFSGIGRILQTSLNRGAIFSRNHINIFNIEDEFLKDSAVRASEILEKWSAPTRFTRPDSTINQEELKKDVEPLINSLSDYFLTSENSKKTGLTAKEVRDFVPVLKSGMPLLINALLSADNNDISINLSEEILNNWPKNNKLFREYEWTKGLIYHILLEKYYDRKEYQKVVNSYNYFVVHESAASSFLENFFATNRLEKIDSAISSTSKELESSFERKNAGASGKALIDLLKDYRPLTLYFIKAALIDSSQKAADSYLKINEPLKAKMLYQKVLSLKEEIPKKYPTIAKMISKATEKGKLSEIYYGIAQSDFMLGNLDEAQTNIEKAIQITETFIPREFLSETSGFTQAGIQYGYGFPNRGYLSVGFNATLSNPWVIPWSSDVVKNYYELKDALDDINKPSTSLKVSRDIDPCSTILDYFSCRQNYFELYITILTKKHQKFPSEQFDVLAFEQSERARTRSMQVLANLNDPLVNYENLSSPQKRLVERKVRLSKSASLTSIRKELLDEDTLIIEYFLGDKISYLWVVSKHGKLQTFELPPRSTIEQKAKEFYNLLTAPSGRVRPQTTAKVGKELSSIILGPISNQLREKRLVIIGDSFLQYLPFSVLPDLNSNDVLLKKGLQGEFAPYFEPLLLKHEIISLPSASSLVALRQDRSSRPKPEQELAFFADPIFNHEDGRVGSLKIGGGDFQPFRIVNLRNVDILYGSLPNTSRELSGAFRIIPRSQRRSYLGFNANLRNALDPNLGHFKIVHFASHGIFNSQAPQRSGIILSSINEQGELQPSLLSASYAFRNMDLSGTELVILSGCRTGFGIGEVAREGLTGFTGGLLSAGTDRVVASLWSVQDEATRELMSRFYERMLDRDNPMTPAQALREAQISMWKDPRWQTPYYWAAFIIQGEWR